MISQRFMKCLTLWMILLCVGCRATPVHTVQVTDVPAFCIRPARDQDVLVGLAVSGGGSRAALFAAGAFEAAESAEVFAAFVLRGFAAVVVLALESVSALRFGGILSDGFFKSKSRKESASCR